MAQDEGPVNINVTVNEGGSNQGSNGKGKKKKGGKNGAPSAAGVVADLDDPVLSHGKTHAHEEAAILHAAEEVIAAAKAHNKPPSAPAVAAAAAPTPAARPLPSVVKNTGAIDPHALHHHHSLSHHRHSTHSRAGSEAGKSHHSHHSHSQAPVVVPVIVNPPAPSVPAVPVPPPAAVSVPAVPSAPVPSVRPPPTVVVNDPPPSVPAAQSVKAPSAAGSDMHLFGTKKANDQPLVETTVTTTTTTHTVPIIPGGLAAPAPAVAPAVVPATVTAPVTVRNSPPVIRPPSLPSGGSIPPAATATVAPPSVGASSEGSKKKKGKKGKALTEVGDDTIVDVNTAGTTLGGPTTAGVGARTMALSDAGVLEQRTPGTSGGLRPIPIIDYQALIRRTPPQTEKLPLPILPKLPSPTIAPTEAPPKSHKSHKDKDKHHHHKHHDEHRPYKALDEVLDAPRDARYAYPPEAVAREQRERERLRAKLNPQPAPGQMPGIGPMGVNGMGPAFRPPFPPLPPPIPTAIPGMMGMGLGPMHMRPPMMMGMGMPGMMGMNPMGMGMGGMGGMGMSMGMPGMMGMGMPGMMGVGMGGMIPGRFGRDMLGRDFAGPGGPGASQPYRPPDPSALPPMPSGLPFIARPGQEGFDQYGRQIPPPLPEGYDGWGRPILGGNPQPPPAPMMQQPFGGSTMPPQQPGGLGLDPNGAEAPAPPPPSAREMEEAAMTTATSRPEQYVAAHPYYARRMGRAWPPAFTRRPATRDRHYTYEPFDAFSLPSVNLNRPHELHLPRELNSHDVNEAEWSMFIDDLSREALSGARHNWSRSSNADGHRGGPQPQLTDGVHSLLSAWLVSYFAPRGVYVYAAKEGRRVPPPPLDRRMRHGIAQSRASDFSSSDDSDYSSDNTYKRRDDMYLPRRERDLRRRQREKERRRERRMRDRDREEEEWSRRRSRDADGDWEVHFSYREPTVWQQDAKARAYGEKIPFERPRR